MILPIKAVKVERLESKFWNEKFFPYEAMHMKHSVQQRKRMKNNVIKSQVPNQKNVRRLLEYL